jgi:hypothetical protein
MPQQLRASSSLFKSVLHYSLICMGGDATQIPEPPNRRAAGDRGIRGRQQSCVLKVAFGQCRSTGRSLVFIRNCVLRCVKASERTNESCCVASGRGATPPFSYPQKHISSLGRRLIISARKRKRDTAIN